jgi:hypothetical protein
MLDTSLSSKETFEKSTNPAGIFAAAGAFEVLRAAD